jgi:hypothetical protein
MTAIALSNARGIPRPVRHGEALEGLSDASQWVLDTLREWRRRSRMRHQLAGLGKRMDTEVTRADAIDLSSKPLLEGVTHMQTTSMQTPARRDGTLLRTVRAVGRWFSRAVNAIGQPNANPEADHWADWPRFPPF